MVITSIDRDGSRKGYDTELISEVSKFCKVPLVVHGGAGTKESVVKVIKKTKIDAVAIATSFHYGDFKIKNLKEYLFKKKINVRV